MNLLPSIPKSPLSFLVFLVSCPVSFLFECRASSVVSKSSTTHIPGSHGTLTFTQLYCTVEVCCIKVEFWPFWSFLMVFPKNITLTAEQCMTHSAAAGTQVVSGFCYCNSTRVTIAVSRPLRAGVFEKSLCSPWLWWKSECIFSLSLQCYAG